MGDRVLICDDAGFIREILSRALMDLGYDIVGEACDGEEALSLAIRFKPDIVILDLVLPLKNGFECARDIRTQLKTVKILAVTSLEQEFLAQEALESGCDAFLQKPFTKLGLKEALDKLRLVEPEVQNG